MKLENLKRDERAFLTGMLTQVMLMEHDTAPSVENLKRAFDKFSTAFCTPEDDEEIGEFLAVWNQAHDEVFGNAETQSSDSTSGQPALHPEWSSNANTL